MWKLKVAVSDRRAHTLASFLDRRGCEADQEELDVAATADVGLDLDAPNVQAHKHACVDIAEHTSEAIETRLGNQPRLLRAQEVGNLVVERLWLLDERHVSRVADDHLPPA